MCLIPWLCLILAGWLRASPFTSRSLHAPLCEVEMPTVALQIVRGSVIVLGVELSMGTRSGLNNGPSVLGDSGGSIVARW